jgi:hypothetical protein
MAPRKAMLEHIFWWAGNLLEGLVLWRGVTTGLVRRYSFFYLYLAYVLLQSLVHLLVFQTSPEWYAHVYWSTQILGAGFGYVVVWGIYAHSLLPFSGAGRMARSLLTIVFVLLITRVGVVAWGNPSALPAAAAEIERDVRAVQAILFLVLLFIYVYYRVPLNANLKGMFLGYGLYISVSVAVLASRALLLESHGLAWRYLQPSAYALALCIWCGYLWSPAAITRPAAKAPLEVDYEVLAGNTAKLFDRLRIYLARAVRP